MKTFAILAAIGSVSALQLDSQATLTVTLPTPSLLPSLGECITLIPKVTCTDIFDHWDHVKDQSEYKTIATRILAAESDPITEDKRAWQEAYASTYFFCTAA